MSKPAVEPLSSRLSWERSSARAADPACAPRRSRDRQARATSAPSAPDRLLGWIGRDRKMRRATEAITEQVRAIPAHESLRTAHYPLSQSGTTRLLVRSRPNALPEGVLSDLDLALAAER
jgi:hypothetical protein